VVEDYPFLEVRIDRILKMLAAELQRGKITI
jgi:hypothetical protein